MTPRSQSAFREYNEEVLKHKAIFIADKFDEKLIIEQQEQFYRVPKFVMVSLSLCGKVIIADDKDSVSFINPENMEKVNSMKLPSDNCYLYTGYFNAASKTYFMSFDNKKIMGVDSERYSTKTNMTLEVACLKFTPFHADPENYAVLSCEESVIKVF
jgi:hypothetical protein